MSLSGIHYTIKEPFGFQVADFCQFFYIFQCGSHLMWSLIFFSLNLIKLIQMDRFPNNHQFQYFKLAGNWLFPIIWLLLWVSLSLRRFTLSTFHWLYFTLNCPTQLPLQSFVSNMIFFITLGCKTLCHVRVNKLDI